MSITVSTLGFPRIGPRRELKSALERFWAGKTNAQSLLADAASLRAASWARQRFFRKRLAKMPAELHRA
jgi:5-methyltetrahydropteroyltriglutamate--homocysteine methyltransferase